MPPIPVTVLTGFLGSGKSTLLGQVLRDARFADTAVIVNEFGAVGLDGALIEHAAEQLVEMSSGCLCCTMRGDLRQTLNGLRIRRAEGATPPFRRLIVETTGLADPAPVLHTLMADPEIQPHWSLGGVITTVDAVNAEATLERHAECVKQIAVADRLVLTKTDLVHDPASRRDLERLTARLRSLAPGAPQVTRADPDFDAEALFRGDFYDLTGKPADVRQWLNAEAHAAPPGGQGHKYGHGHGHRHHHEHHHDINRHGADIEAYCLVLDQPISRIAFTLAMELLASYQGPDLLRLKGIVHIAERPDRPLVIHGVQHLFHPPVWLERWPDEDRRTRLVVIARNIPRKVLETFFAAWQKLSPGLGAPASRA